MKIDDFEFKLKDGRTAIIRSPKDEDIQGTLDYLYKSAGETLGRFLCAEYVNGLEKGGFNGRHN